MNSFDTAQNAFEYFATFIRDYGLERSDSKFTDNVLIKILNPKNNLITTPYRKWKKSYADKEWNWYLSKNMDVRELAKSAPMWNKMHSGNGLVNSNYGYQWNRNNQLLYIVKMLNEDRETRRAVLTIYDGKEHAKYDYDTPCTLNIQFSIYNNFLDMCVMMRSNDLWYGFCNDQYCFSNLQIEIAALTHTSVGSYCHFVNNLHVYKKDLPKIV